MAKKNSTKKEIRQKISDQLLSTFEHLKNHISERKFKRNIRQASKALTAGLKSPEAPKKKEKKPKESKKQTDSQIKIA